MENFVIGPSIFSLNSLKNFLFKMRRKMKGENIASSNNQNFPSVHWVTFSNFPSCVFVFFKLFELTFTLLFIFQRFNQTVDFASFFGSTVGSLVAFTSFFDQRFFFSKVFQLSPLFIYITKKRKKKRSNIIILIMC